MKKILVLAVLMLSIASISFAASVVGSSHDMRAYVANEGTQQVCVFCHTPHQAATANGVDPLWNKQLSAVAAYGVYGSATLNSTPAEVGGGTTTTNLCLSCHDGTVAVNALYKPPVDGSAGDAISVTGTALLGTSLVDDHPVNMVYDATLATADGGLVTPASTALVVAGIPLFAGTVQCASCHDVHDSTNVPFLRATNVASALCLTCHIK